MKVCLLDTARRDAEDERRIGEDFVCNNAPMEFGSARSTRCIMPTYFLHKHPFLNAAIVILRWSANQ